MACIPCPLNTYSSSRQTVEVEGRQQCTPCPLNFETSGVGQTSALACLCRCVLADVPRPALTCVRRRGVGNSSSCGMCPPGTYLDALANTCRACPSGLPLMVHCAKPYLMHFVAGSTSPSGSTGMASCVCEAGSRLMLSQQGALNCEPCPLHMYSSSARMACTPCPAKPVPVPFSIRTVQFLVISMYSPT